MGMGNHSGWQVNMQAIMEGWCCNFRMEISRFGL